MKISVKNINVNLSFPVGDELSMAEMILGGLKTEKKESPIDSQLKFDFDGKTAVKLTPEQAQELFSEYDERIEEYERQIKKITETQNQSNEADVLILSEMQRLEKKNEQLKKELKNSKDAIKRISDSFFKELNSKLLSLEKCFKPFHENMLNKDIYKSDEAVNEFITSIKAWIFSNYTAKIK